MREPSQRMVFLADLGALVDGDTKTEERHAALLQEQSVTRSLRDEARLLAERIGRAGSDYRTSEDFARELTQALDAYDVEHSFPEAGTASAGAADVVEAIEDPPATQKPPPVQEEEATVTSDTEVVRRPGGARRRLWVAVIGAAAIFGSAAVALQVSPDARVALKTRTNALWQRLFGTTAARRTDARDRTPATAPANFRITQAPEGVGYGVTLTAVQPEHSSPHSKGELSPGHTLTTDTRTLAILRPSTGRVSTTVARGTTLTWVADVDRTLALDGALLFEGDVDDADTAWTIRTRHGDVKLAHGLCAVHSGPDTLQVSVLRGKAYVEPKQHPPRLLGAGRVLRVPLRGPITEDRLWDAHNLLADFTPFGTRGSVGMLSPLAAADLWGEDPRPAPRWPLSHHAHMMISAKEALVEVTEMFQGSAGDPPARYSLPLPPGAQLLDISGGTATTGERFAVHGARMGDEQNAPVATRALLAPVPIPSGILEITTHYVLPLWPDGDYAQLRYWVAPPAPPRGSPVAFSATVLLQDTGTLEPHAPFVTRHRNGRELRVSTRVEEGLELRINVHEEVPDYDGKLRHYAVPKGPVGHLATPGAQPPVDLTGVGLGELSLSPPVPLAAPTAHHLVVVIDGSVSAHVEAQALSRTLVQELLALSTAADRVSILTCGIRCDVRPPEVPPAGPQARARLAREATRLRAAGSFDLGRALLHASTIAAQPEAATTPHIVVLASGVAGTGTTDPARFARYAALALGQTALPMTSVVQVRPQTPPDVDLAGLTRTLGGRLLTVGSTVAAKAASHTLLRHSAIVPLRNATLTLQAGDRRLTSIPLPNLGADRIHHVWLDPQDGPADQAVLAGLIGRMPFEHRYILRPPPPALEITAQSLRFYDQRLRHPATAENWAGPSPPQDASPAAVEAALAAYDMALPKRPKSEGRPDRTEIKVLSPDEPPWPKTARAEVVTAGRALDQAPADPTGLHRYVDRLCHYGPLAECIALLERLAHAPAGADRRALASLSTALLRSGDHTAAVAALANLAQLWPASAPFHSQLGRLQLQLGQTEAACSHLLRAAELTGQQDARERAGDCYGRLPGPAARTVRSWLAALPEAPTAVQPGLAETSAQDSLKVEATWTGNADYDLCLIDHAGATWNLLSPGIDPAATLPTGHEVLVLPAPSPGVYTVELIRQQAANAADSTGPSARSPTVQIAIDALGKTLRTNVRPTATRTAVARIAVHPQ